MVTVSDKGRIGNLMSQYMTLLGESKRLGFLPIMSNKMAQALIPIFPHLSVPSLDILPCSCNWTNVSHNLLRKMKTSKELFAFGNNILLTGSPNHLEIFERYFPTVLGEFTFNQGVMSEVNTYFKEIKAIFRSRMSLDKKDDVIIIGIHNRRTDYGRYLIKQGHGRLLSIQYFENAMKAFVETHGNGTLFVMTSDDPQWLFKHFKKRKDVFFSFQNWPRCGNKVMFDLAVCANANHSIFR